MYLCHAWPQSYDHRSSHSYNTGTERVRFSPTRQIILAPSAKRGGVLSHEGRRVKGGLHRTKNRL